MFYQFDRVKFRIVNLGFRKVSVRVLPRSLHVLCVYKLVVSVYYVRWVLVEETGELGQG